MNSAPLTKSRQRLFRNIAGIPTHLSVIVGVTLKVPWPNLYQASVTWHHVNARILKCTLGGQHDHKD
jgi:hypothetical protein